MIGSVVFNVSEEVLNVKLFEFTSCRFSFLLFLILNSWIIWLILSKIEERTKFCTENSQRAGSKYWRDFSDSEIY